MLGAYILMISLNKAYWSPLRILRSSAHSFCKFMGSSPLASRFLLIFNSSILGPSNPSILAPRSRVRRPVHQNWLNKDSNTVLTGIRLKRLNGRYLQAVMGWLVCSKAVIRVDNQLHRVQVVNYAGYQFFADCIVQITLLDLSQALDNVKRFQLAPASMLLPSPLVPPLAVTAVSIVARILVLVLLILLFLARAS